VGSEPWSSHTSFEESFRILRSNLTVTLSEIDQPVVLVTSTKENEGKTVVSAKLALSFAQAGKRVVLVDLDLRHPAAHRLLRTHNEFGTSDVLLGDRPLKDTLQQLEFSELDERGPRSIYFLAAGSPVQNPAELLGSGRTARLLDSLAKQADLVLVDSPPVLPVADTLVIARYASGAILVAESRITGFPALLQAKDVLIRNQTRLLGVVMNKFHSRDAGASHRFYRYGYSGSAGANGAGDSADRILHPATTNGSNGSAAGSLA
jgi:capsular exopolysaccharide synthesis family protein